MKGTGVRSVVRNSGFLIGSTTLTTLLRGVYVIVLARLLGPDAYGTLNYGISWYLTFIALTYLGLDVVLGREVGRGHNMVPSLVGSTFVLRAGVAVVVCVLSTIIAIVAESNSVARELLVIFSIALIGRAIWLWCMSVFSAFEDTRHVFFIEFFFRPLEIVAVVFVLLLLPHKSIFAVGVIHAALWWFQGTIGVFTVLRYVTPMDLSANWSQAKQLLVAGVPGGLYTLAFSWFMQAPIVLYRQTFGTGEDLGYFSLSIQVIGYLVIIPYLAGSAALPVLSRSAARGDGKDRTVALAMLTLIPTIGVVLAAVGMWLAPLLTELIFGVNFGYAGIILSEAIWLLIPFSLVIGLQQIAFARGSHVVVSLPGILGAVVMTGLFVPLAQALSYRGALLATGLGMTVWAGGVVIALIRRGFFKLGKPNSR